MWRMTRDANDPNTFHFYEPQGVSIAPPLFWVLVLAHMPFFVLDGLVWIAGIIFCLYMAIRVIGRNDLAQLAFRANVCIGLMWVLYIGCLMFFHFNIFDFIAEHFWIKSLLATHKYNQPKPRFY